MYNHFVTSNQPHKLHLNVEYERGNRHASLQYGGELYCPRVLGPDGMLFHNTIEDETMARKSELPASKRVEAVLALLRKEDTGAQVARRYGVSEPTLYR